MKGLCRKLFSFFVLLSLTVVGCGNEGESVGAKPGEFSSADLLLRIEGNEWGLMQDAAGLEQLLEGGEYSETISCAYDGMDKMFVKDGVTLCTLPMDGKDMIDEIQLTTEKYSTSKDIKVGSTMEEVIVAYGEDFTRDGDVITYWAGESEGLKTPRLYLNFSGENVSMISIYGARSSG